ncbi:hypothetical protein [Ignavigranum ruoffiae]|uniref:hypothetical protein n=1 Tax=Ignavigranum ruoffiae TaxID=89093 RepID=UPI0024AD4F63|nr:hypothetical protein [Ignavigranum ruoffiae]
MSWWQKFFVRKKSPVSSSELSSITSENTSKNYWDPVPPYIPVDKDEQHLVSLITAAIAAHDKKQSNFKIISIYKRNPEIQRVSVIASALASAISNNSNYKITKISKKKVGE